LVSVSSLDEEGRFPIDDLGFKGSFLVLFNCYSYVWLLDFSLERVGFIASPCILVLALINLNFRFLWTYSAVAVTSITFCIKLLSPIFNFIINMAN